MIADNFGRALENDTADRVLIIGSGPSGMAVSKCLTDRGVGHQLVDHYGDAGGAYVRMYPRMYLSSPPNYLGLPKASSPQGDGHISAGQYASYLRQYADQFNIRPLRRTVRRIIRDEREFFVEFEGGHGDYFAAVVVCTGMFDNPHVPAILGLGGAGRNPQDSIRWIHACEWTGPSLLSGKRVLIVGDGMTAVELAEESVRGGITPILSSRSPMKPPFPGRILGVEPRFITYPLMRRAPLWMFRKQCGMGWKFRGIDRGFWNFTRRHMIELRPMIREVNGRCVTFADGSHADIDLLVFATGYRFNMPFLPEGLREGIDETPRVRDGESVMWPGLYCVGVPCARKINSHFIFGIAEDAAVVSSAIESRLALCKAQSLLTSHSAE